MTKTFIVELDFPEGSPLVNMNGTRCIVHTFNAPNAVKRSAKEWCNVTGDVWPMWSDRNKWTIRNAELEVLCTATILYQHSSRMSHEKAVAKMISFPQN